jgi:magnesium chelatase subunit ChlD-like protein
MKQNPPVENESSSALQTYLAASRHRNHYIPIQPSSAFAKKGLKTVLPLPHQHTVKGMKKTGSIDVIKTARTYVINDTVDIQFKHGSGKGKVIVVFLIDSSSSMLKDQQIAYVKGLIEKTLQRYQQQELKYAVISLQQGDAKLVSPPTKDTQRLLNEIANLATGGKTNLVAGFQLVHKLLENSVREKSCLYIFTDGRINTGNTTSPFAEAIRYYRTFLKRIGEVNIIDNETGFVRLGRSKELAKAIGGNYFTVNSSGLTLLKQTL